MPEPLFAIVLLFVCLTPLDAGAETITLSQGIRMAVEKNRQISLGRIDESIAEDDRMIALSRMLPSINAGGRQTWLGRQPEAIFGNATVPVSQRTYLSYSVTVQQTLYDFGANLSRYEASKVLLQTRHLETSRIRNLVALQFVLTYFSLLESNRMVTVAEHEEERIAAHFRDANARYDEGVITKNDLLQAAVKLSDVRQRLLTAQSLRDITVSQLNTLLALPLTNRVELEEYDSAATLIEGIDREKAWSEAANRRPEIAIADETIRVLELEKKAKNSEYLPRLYLQGGYDYTENRYQAHEGNWSMILGMSINLFQGGQTRAELAKTEHQRLKILEQKNKLLDDIRLEVDQYYLAARIALERIGVTKDAMAQAEENLRINTVRYSEGVGTATDVLDAVALLTVAETNYYRALYDLRKAEATFAYAIGKDLTEVYRQ
ncbi:MAG: TolC family protein [Thermodesulfovibrionales bacterium]